MLVALLVLVAVTSQSTLPDSSTAQLDAFAPVVGERLERSAYGPSRIETFVSTCASAPWAPPASAIDALPRPLTLELAPSASPGVNAPVLSPGASPPSLAAQFPGQFLFDAGITSIPPDCSMAVGRDHVVTVVNRHIAIWDKATGARLFEQLFSAFFSSVLGDPRVVHDPFSDRFFVTAGDFNSRVYLAASVSGDPTAGWFKTSFVVSQGSDAARFPDFPTLGVDGAALYVSALMGAGAPDTHSVFVLEKAPLLAPAPALGVITAFRQVPLNDGTIQPCLADVANGPMHLLSMTSSGALRVRRVDPPVTAPTLVSVGTLPVAPFLPTTTAPAMGSTTNLDLGDVRLSPCFQRDGRVWTSHHVLESSGVSSARWYEIDLDPLSLVQAGTVSVAGRFHFYPSIAVNAEGDAVLGFGGSSATQFAAAYVCGRLATDPPSLMSAPAVLRAGESAYNRLDAFGRNRWGDYSTTVPDPFDPRAFWTFQEFARAGNTWGTSIAKLVVDRAGESFCAGDGVDPSLSSACPCANTGALDHGCANSAHASGALLATSGLVLDDDVVLHATRMPSSAAAIFLKGDAEELGGLVFGDGVRCVGGTLLRLGSAVGVVGAASYPGPANPPLSTRGNTPVGSGLTGVYQAYYRNSAVGFCPSATFNVTNGVRIAW